MINVPAKARQRYRTALVRLMVPMENRFARAIKPLLARQWTYAATEIENGHVEGIASAVRSQTGRLSYLRRNHLQRVVATFQVETERAINRMTKAAGDEFWLNIDDWIKAHTANLMNEQAVGQIAAVKAIVKTSIDAGLGYVAIAKEIKAKGIRDSGWKAMRIARTETHNAAIKSTDVQMQTARLVYSKRWVAAIDARTRPAHLAGNSHALVEKGKLFTIGGDKMEFPGDGAHGAAAGNVINCRCVLLYEVDRSKQRRPRRR